MSFVRLPAGLRSTSTAFIAAATKAAAAAVAAEATATTITTAAKTTSAAAAATILARARFVDRQRATGNFPPVKLFNRRRRFIFGRHFDKRKTFRAAGVAIFDHAG
jgi:hypothetical protein